MTTDVCPLGNCRSETACRPPAPTCLHPFYSRGRFAPTQPIVSRQGPVPDVEQVEYPTMIQRYVADAQADLARRLADAGRVPAPGAEVRWAWSDDGLTLSLAVDTVPAP